MSAAEMSSDVRVWLKHQYKSAAVSGPECKRMKFSDIIDRATIVQLPNFNPHHSVTAYFRMPLEPNSLTP